MGNAPPSRGAAASLSRGELGAVVAIVLMLRRWARSSWRGVFAYARSWRSSCLRTCGHYDGGTGSRHEGASSSWRGWPIRRADLPLPRAGSSIRRAGSPLRKSNLPLRRGDLRQECHKSGDNVMKNETGRVYGIFRSVFPAGIPRIACLYSGCFEIRYIIARFAASGHRFCRCRYRVTKSGVGPFPPGSQPRPICYAALLFLSNASSTSLSTLSSPPGSSGRGSRS